MGLENRKNLDLVKFPAIPYKNCGCEGNYHPPQLWWVLEQGSVPFSFSSKTLATEKVSLATQD